MFGEHDGRLEAETNHPDQPGLEDSLEEAEVAVTKDPYYSVAGNTALDDSGREHLAV